MNDTSSTRAKNLEFGILKQHDSYIYYMASERLQGGKQFHFKSYLLEMLHFHTKMRLKSAPQKLNFLMEKDI